MQAEDSRLMLESYSDRWALVTGASSGIGEAFAQRLAALGMHLVLTARRGDLLEKLAEDLHVRHGTRCEILPGDLSDPHRAQAIVRDLESRDIEIELLVNNAGFGIVAEIEETDVERIMQMTRLNIGALTELTYRILPGMLSRGRGGVINISSVAGFQPVAYMAAYAASKAYVLHFSEALWAETRGRGVTVTAVCPGVTTTSFFDVAGVPGWLKKQRAHTPERVVRKALRAFERKKQYVVCGWRNYLRSLAVRFGTRRTVVTSSMKYFRPKRRS